jgi:hypothetical protein
VGRAGVRRRREPRGRVVYIDNGRIAVGETKYASMAACDAVPSSGPDAACTVDRDGSREASSRRTRQPRTPVCSDAKAAVGCRDGERTASATLPHWRRSVPVGVVPTMPGVSPRSTCRSRRTRAHPRGANVTSAGSRRGRWSSSPRGVAGVDDEEPESTLETSLTEGYRARSESARRGIVYGAHDSARAGVVGPSWLPISVRVKQRRSYCGCASPRPTVDRSRSQLSERILG